MYHRSSVDPVAFAGRLAVSWRLLVFLPLFGIAAFWASALTASLGWGQTALVGAALDAALTDVVAGLWPKVPDGWEARVRQDETQRQCSISRNNPPAELGDAIRAREEAAIIFPADGKFLGDWKKGRAIAENGRGGQFSDPPGTVSGGNCYACHRMAPAELSYGTLGPTLVGYGRERGYDPQAMREAYAKIYNAQSALPCSNMPRFGTNAVLSEEQIKDVVAFLFDSESPVNQISDK